MNPNGNDATMDGRCECGCGTPTPIAKLTNRKLGHTKGHPVRFCRGHARTPRPSLADRFWAKVTKEPSGCWIWTGSRNSDGYGRVWFNGRKVLAHRVAWILARGPIEDGVRVLHNCPTGDNPACVNEAHLWQGTDADNTADMMVKGRHRYTAHYGAANGRFRADRKERDQ